MFVSSLQAQTPPSISNDWRGSGYTTDEDHTRAFLDGLLIRSRSPYSRNNERQTVGDTPLAPATLLLLGLGSVAVGGTVYRNTKKRQ